MRSSGAWTRASKDADAQVIREHFTGQWRVHRSASGGSEEERRRPSVVRIGLWMRARSGNRPHTLPSGPASRPHAECVRVADGERGVGRHERGSGLRHRAGHPLPAKLGPNRDVDTAHDPILPPAAGEPARQPAREADHARVGFRHDHERPAKGLCMCFQWKYAAGSGTAMSLGQEPNAACKVSTTCGSSSGRRGGSRSPYGSPRRRARGPQPPVRRRAQVKAEWAGPGSVVRLPAPSRPWQRPTTNCFRPCRLRDPPAGAAPRGRGRASGRAATRPGRRAQPGAGRGSRSLATSRRARPSAPA